jgi:hypothetical protein
VRRNQIAFAASAAVTAALVQGPGTSTRFFSSSLMPVNHTMKANLLMRFQLGLLCIFGMK